MTQKEIDTFLCHTKVYVNGKSKEIQEKLFSLGYTWGGNTMIVCYTDEPFLYIRKDKTIAHGSLMDSFMNNSKSEITAEQILSLELTEPAYRPFKYAKECYQEMLKHNPFGWVKRIDTGYFANIAVASDYGIMFREGKEHFYDMALKEYIFADGTPFGIKEE